MMHVTREGLEQIKRANDLAAVITERGIKLQRKGRVLVARCPFHEEKTPSFTITPSKGLFHCFGCDVGGDVIGFVTRYDGMKFPQALESLAKRAGLALSRLMEPPARIQQHTPVQALTPLPDSFFADPKTQTSTSKATSSSNATPSRQNPAPPSDGPPSRPSLGHIVIPSFVVEHYYKTFCEREDAQAYLKKRGLTDPDIFRAHRIGYADGSLLKLVPKKGELRDRLTELGVITQEGRELFGGCVVVPIQHPTTAMYTTLYGRGLRTSRHCYLPGPLRGVFNFEAARSSEEVILAESVFDALSFHQAGIFTAIPLYGTNGLTPDHLDTFKRERVKRVILALDNDDAGRKATPGIKAKLEELGLAVRVARFPRGIKDANELLVSKGEQAGEVFRKMLAAAEPVTARTTSTTTTSSSRPGANGQTASLLNENLDHGSAPASSSATSSGNGDVVREDHGQLVLNRAGLIYRAKVYPVMLGRLRATVKVERAAAAAGASLSKSNPGAAATPGYVPALSASSKTSARHVDTLDLYASRSRAEFARRASKVVATDAETIEEHLLVLLVEAEKTSEDTDTPAGETPDPPPMSEAERAEALEFLKRPDLLDQIAKDIDTLGCVGEEVNKRLLYLVAVSRKLPDPLSAVILSQSGAGKSGISEVIERLTPPEDVVLLTRLTPQSLYYTEQGFLDQKLIIVEERHGSMEADYSIRVLQSRKKLIAAVPVKDPQTGNLKTKIFSVEARAAFIEATTASGLNHENATRCFELTMDESVQQTARIHAQQRHMRTEAGLSLKRKHEGITRRHWNAQRLLEPLSVVIPFADKLTFPAAWMRTRRDHARFLNLIEVSAFLHQHQREIHDEAVVATVDDYAASYELSSQLLADTLADVRKPLRDAYKSIRELAVIKGGTVSRREIREDLSVHDSTVRRWLSELVELEYLAIAETGQRGAGKITRYSVIERDAREAPGLGLISPEELRSSLQKKPSLRQKPPLGRDGF